MPSSRPVQFRGAFTAVTTPFTADGSGGVIDFGLLKEQIEFQAAGGVAGVVLAGTTGESPTLEPEEWRDLIERGVRLARGAGILAVAGTGSNSTSHACALQRFAAAAGADAALSVNPYYNKPGQEGLYAHFMEQADAAALPIILYNIPGRTGVALAPDTVAQLAKHPNIRAIKEATGSTDSASEILLKAPGLALLSGDDSMTLPFAAVGGVGVVSVVSNLFPARISALCDAFLSNRWADALKIHRELLPLCKAMFAETNPIPVKAAMKLLGRDTGTLRLPMTPASPATIKTLEGLLAGFRHPVHA
ncbi:MAG: 4-hydroxy-tetrahydrodipicolinate synthase [Phycisphaerales bacterium]|nr:4-hydroxy-tetrahydrodipicolinate synthase [Phycisphaerales bacterium]